MEAGPPALEPLDQNQFGFRGSLRVDRTDRFGFESALLHPAEQIHGPFGRIDDHQPAPLAKHPAGAFDDLGQGDIELMPCQGALRFRVYPPRV